MNIQEILEKHKKWILCKEGGEKAKLKYESLSGVNLSGADLRGADLSYADFRNANLSYVDFGDADLRYANFGGVNLECVDLRYTDLSYADFRGADLRDTDLRGADFKYANLSGAKILSQIDYIKDNFDNTEDGVIVYKTFNQNYTPPENWVIHKGSIITENVNFDRTNDCGCGINVATLEWVQSNNRYNKKMWKCLIRWEWLCGVCVPYNTDGKIRCEKVELLEVV